MNDAIQNTNSIDPLLSIDLELDSILGDVSFIEKEDPLTAALNNQSEGVSIDPITQAEETQVILSIPEELPVVEIQKERSAIVEFTKEFGRYIAISSAVFAVLLVGTNLSAYSSIAWNYFSPDSLKTSSAEISENLLKSKITVFASDSESGVTEADRQKQADELKKKLEEENITVQENVFSPKKLIPTMPSVSVDLDVMPYDNRIIIPKLGKNIPLVDVEHQEGFDFDHMENIFMQELQKGVVRYPGTATPGNNGNAFIFGHSSNYPWVKGEYNEVFALLDNLDYGDEIIVYYNQKKFTYVVREKKVVKPTDVKAISRDESKKELSLMTCWPVGTTLKRMIVSSELKEETSVK